MPRKTFKDIVGVGVSFEDEKIFFNDNLSPEDTEVHSVSVVIPSTRGRIMKHRPKVNKWKCSFTVSLENDFLSKDNFQEILKHAGERVGVGDWRVGKGGPFGTFKVVSVNEI